MNDLPAVGKTFDEAEEIANKDLKMLKRACLQANVV